MTIGVKTNPYLQIVSPFPWLALLAVTVVPSVKYRSAANVPMWPKFYVPTIAAMAYLIHRTRSNVCDLPNNFFPAYILLATADIITTQLCQ